MLEEMKIGELYAWNAESFYFNEFTHNNNKTIEERKIHDISRGELVLCLTDKKFFNTSHAGGEVSNLGQVVYFKNKMVFIESFCIPFFIKVSL